MTKTCNTSSPASLGYYCYIWTHSFLRNDQWLPVYHKTHLNISISTGKTNGGGLEVAGHACTFDDNRTLFTWQGVHSVKSLSGLSFKITGRLFVRNYLHHSFRIYTKHTWKWLMLKLGLKRFYRVQFYRDILLSIHWQEIQNYKMTFFLEDMFSWECSCTNSEGQIHTRLLIAMCESDIGFVKTASVHESIPACDGQYVPGV